jgi:hypothetical protein
MRNHCPGCEAKADEIADLKRELAALRSWNRTRLLVDTLKMRPTFARMLVVLYDAGGETVRREVLDTEARTLGYIRVWVSQMRAALGRDAIITVGDGYRSIGYRLSAEGMEMVRDVLEPDEKGPG